MNFEELRKAHKMVTLLAEVRVLRAHNQILQEEIKRRNMDLVQAKQHIAKLSKDLKSIQMTVSGALKAGEGSQTKTVTRKKPRNVRPKAKYCSKCGVARSYSKLCHCDAQHDSGNQEKDKIPNDVKTQFSNFIVID